MINFLFVESRYIIKNKLNSFSNKLHKVYSLGSKNVFLTELDNKNFIVDNDIFLFFKGFSELNINGIVFSSSSSDFVNRLKEAYLSMDRDFKSLVEKISGVFSILVIDSGCNKTYIANDYFNHNNIYFKSDDISTVVTSDFLLLSNLRDINEKPVIDRNSIALLMRHNCIPAPYTIYENIFKLSVGQFAVLSLGQSIYVDSYTNISEYLNNKKIETKHSEAGLVDVVEESISNAIDFTLGKYKSSPVGAFLSGGVDSSLVCAILSSKVDSLQTYSLGFKDPIYDESALASEMAKSINANHKILYFDSSDILNLVKKLPDIYAEPFADSSQIPTYLMSKFVPSGTLVFSGDGGDEVFGGYNRYLTANKIWSRFKYLPISIRCAFSNIILKYPPIKWDMIFEKLYAVLPQKFHLSQPGDKLHKLACVLPHQTGYDFYRELTSHWKSPEKVVLGATEPPTLLTNKESWPDVDTFEEWMMAMDLQTYVPDDALVKVGMAAKYNNITVNSPFLHKNVVELAFSLPMKYKINNGTGKWVLREILKKYYPDTLLNQPKKGFGIPLDKLLREELKSWASDLLDRDRLKEEGYFDSDVVHNVWQEHLSGKVNNQYMLWNILMFQAWKERYV